MAYIENQVVLNFFSILQKWLTVHDIDSEMRNNYFTFVLINIYTFAYDKKIINYLQHATELTSIIKISLISDVKNWNEVPCTSGTQSNFYNNPHNIPIWLFVLEKVILRDEFIKRSDNQKYFLFRKCYRKKII